MTEQQGAGGSFTRHVAKKALAPIVTTAATAITAYLMRKTAEAWEEHVQPKLEERGGSKAVATEALESLRERIPDSASEKLDELTAKTGETAPKRAAEKPTSDGDRNEERRKREQRRKQRRKSLEQAGSS